MKKFFQGGGTATDSGLRAFPSQSGELNSHRLYQANSNSANLLQMPNGGYISSTNTPLTPQYTTPTQQYFDIQRTGTISPAPSSTMMLGSSVLAPVQISPVAANVAPVNSSNTDLHTIERNELHKGLKSLETLLVTFDDYRDLKSKLAKCEKRLAKNLGELSKSKMLEDTPFQTLQVSAQIFDSIADTTCKHAKLIQKEYEALNEHCGKYFKKVIKEERIHDELLDTLDSKIKKAHANHEKNSKKSGRIAMESHDKYIQTVQSLTQDISRVKINHNTMVGQKTFITSLVLASTLGGIADSEFKALCENVRKSGPFIGKLNEWLNFASTEGMTSIQPIDLSEDAMGWAQVLAIKEAEIRDEMVKQEQARYAQLEHTQTVIKAQQMGWTPPTNQEQVRRADVTTSRDEPIAMANLPRLDSSGQLIETIKTERPTMSRAVTRATSQPNSPAFKQKKKKPEPLQQSFKIAEQASKLEEETQHSLQSSMADGTIIDRGEIIKSDLEDQQSKLSSPTKSVDSFCRDGSDTMTSMSTSLSKASASASDDSSLHVDSSNSSRRSIGPLTPKEEEPKQVVIIKGASEQVEGILKKPDLSTEETDIKVERPTDRYADVAVMPRRVTVDHHNYPTIQRTDSIEERTKRLSLWEHEKEREKQVEREVELQRRLMEAENRLRKMDTTATTATATTATTTTIPKYRQTEISRPRYSESNKSYRIDEEIPAQRYEPERYAPALGSSRLTSAGVNRTLSTDSERSFVARMKAKYQEEKNPSNRSVSTVKPSSISYAVYATDSFNPSSSQSRYDSSPRQIEEHRGIHSANCGCYFCSARHYSSGGTMPKNVPNQLASPPAPPPRHPAVLNQPANHRRQSMPPVRDERNNLSAPPPPSREVYARRSFEDEPDRRVMFANDYQTIR